MNTEKQKTLEEWCEELRRVTNEAHCDGVIFTWSGDGWIELRRGKDKSREVCIW